MFCQLATTPPANGQVRLASLISVDIPECWYKMAALESHCEADKQL